MFLKQYPRDVSATSTFVPAVTPPPGIISNPTHPVSLAWYTHVTTGVCLFFITTFFFLRTYVRVRIKRTWVFEDGE